MAAHVVGHDRAERGLVAGPVLREPGDRGRVVAQGLELGQVSGGRAGEHGPLGEQLEGRHELVCGIAAEPLAQQLGAVLPVRSHDTSGDREAVRPAETAAEQVGRRERAGLDLDGRDEGGVELVQRGQAAHGQRSEPGELLHDPGQVAALARVGDLERFLVVRQRQRENHRSGGSGSAGRLEGSGVAGSVAVARIGLG